MSTSSTDLTTEPADGQANAAVTPGIPDAPVPKVKTLKEKVLGALAAEIEHANAKFADKERLRYATIKNKNHLQFYQRFQQEGNKVLVLAVKLSARRNRILASKP